MLSDPLCICNAEAEHWTCARPITFSWPRVSRIVHVLHCLLFVNGVWTVCACVLLPDIWLRAFSHAQLHSNGLQGIRVAAYQPAMGAGAART